jgi:phosphate transport system substrate-binding protein
VGDDLLGARQTSISRKRERKKNKKMKRSSVLITLALFASLTVTAFAGAKGTLKIAGSTTVLPLAQLWAEEYMGKNPDASISVSGGGTGTGISMLLNGTCDIANASREASFKELDTAKSRNSKLNEVKLARDGLAIIVHPGNNVKNLTLAQLEGIYSGKFSTWRDVGGNSNKAIVVVGRDSSSGTYGFFQEAVLHKGAYRKDTLAQASNAAVAQAVSQSQDAIGYVGMAYAEEFEKQHRVSAVSISRKKGDPGMVPSAKTVMTGEYPLFRYLYAYTLGSPRGLGAAFLKWCTGTEGQALVEKAGYLPLK